MLHKTVAVAGLLLATAALKADHFDDHQLANLQGVEKSAGSRKVTDFSLTDLAVLPKVVHGSPQSVLIVVRTDERNWCKLLVRAGGIKRKGTPQPRPFLHLERLVTYSADPNRGVLADKRDIYLFDGFAVDLDLGQVVKIGEGDDLNFGAIVPREGAVKKEAMMEGETRLGPLTGLAKGSSGVDLFIPRAPLVAPTKPIARTKSSGAVTVNDFVGKYRLDVDGRFTGVLDLRLDEGKLKGTFASDQTGAVYKANGACGAPAHHANLSIAFPRTELKLDGRLFTRGRTKIAGSATMEENAFGFVAERID